MSSTAAPPPESPPEPPSAQPQARTVGQRLARGFAWSSVGAVGWKALTAVSSIFVARILGPAGFGELGIVRSTANLFTVYAGFRLGTTASKHIAEFREDDPAKAGRVLKMTLVMSFVFCLLTGAVLVLGGGYLAEVTLNNADLAWPLRLAGVFLFFNAYTVVRESILVGTEHFREYAKVNLAKGISTAVLIVPGAWFFGVTGAVAALALASFLTYLLLQHYIRRALADFGMSENVAYAEWKAELPLLWTFALPGLLAGAIAALMPWYGRTVITGLESGYVELGLFEAANQWRTMILFLPAILTRVAMPILAETFGRGKTDDFRNAVILQFDAIVLLTLPLTVGVIVLSQPLMWVFGEAFSASGALLPVLMLSVFMFAINQALRRVHDGANFRWQYLSVQLAWAAAFAAVVWLAVPSMGAMGLVLAVCAAEAVMLVIQLAYVELRIAPGTLGRMLASLALAALALALAVYSQMGDTHDLAMTLALAGLALAVSAIPALRLAPQALKMRRKKEQVPE